MTFRQFVYRNVFRNKRTYAAYFFSSAFSVMIFFVYALFIFHPGIQEGVAASVAVQLMIAAEFIMYFFSFFFVFYSVSAFLKTRKNEFGILMMHGMTKKQLNQMVFLENMLIGSAAIITGIAFGVLTAKLFFMIGSIVIGIDSLPFYLSLKALILTIAAFLLLFFFISLFTSRMVRFVKIIDLFQAGQKPKKEPKASVILSLLAAVLLIASYYLAATATMGTLIIRVFPVIAMTIVGTYLFYTQLSVFMMKIFQKNEGLFWKRTNILTISSLAYRLKDNAQMFFMVTIVSTVAFCAVGTLASMNVLNKQFALDYPAAISYIAKDDQPVHQQNLRQIESELQAKDITYSTFQMPIKYVEVQSEPNMIPVVAFSDYGRMSQEAGFSFTEKPLSGDESLGMLTAQTDYVEPESYTLKQEQLTLTSNVSTKNVVIPSRLIEEEDGFVISDELFNKLSAVKTEQFTGFFLSEFEKTAGVADSLAEEGRVLPSESNSYALTVSGTLLNLQMSLYSTMLFVALLIGAVFFIAAGSFLYFRLYADLDTDIRQFLTIKKVGLTDKELNKVITRQLLLLFFVPIFVAIVHSAFAFMALQSFFSHSIANEMTIVLACFTAAQLIYFFFIRNRYLRNLKKALI